MSLNSISKNASDEITALFADAISDEQKSKVAQIVDSALKQAAEKCGEAHREATVQCCGPEADLAHKIAEEARKKTDLLISNLSAMR